MCIVLGKRGFIPDDHCRLRLPRTYTASQTLRARDYRSDEPCQDFLDGEINKYYVLARSNISRRDSQKIKAELIRQNKELDRRQKNEATLTRKPQKANVKSHQTRKVLY